MTKKRLIKWIEENDCESIIKIVENKIKEDNARKQLVKIQTNSKFEFGNTSIEFRKIKDEYFKRTYKVNNTNNKTRCILNEMITKESYERGINQYTLLCDICKQIKDIVTCNLPSYKVYDSDNIEELELRFLNTFNSYDYITLSIDNNYKTQLFYNVESEREICLASPDYIKQVKEILKCVQNIR